MPKLLGLKLIHRMAAAPGLVTVWVDGNPSVPETTPDRVWKNGFSLGSSGGPLQADREYVDLGTLRSSYENGKELVFRFLGRRAWCNDPTNSTRWSANDVVELWAERPLARADVATPAWHLNGAPAGTVQRLFYGHVRRVQTQETGLEITVTDTRWKANGIILRTALGECDIPRIAFNLPKDAPDYVYNSLKLKDPATAPPWGTGVPLDPTNDRLTVKQVLQYLADKYRTLLVLQGIQDPALDYIFAAEDLAHLSYKMGPITLSDCGFTDGIKQILDSWAPHLRIVVDHRSTQWRLVQYGAALKESSTTGTVLAMDGPSGLAACAASDPSFFVVGQRYRFYGGGTIAAPLYQLSQELTVDHVVGSTVYFQGTLLWAFMSWKAAPIDEFTMPNLLLNLDDAPRGGVELALDVDGVYSAVQLWSIYRVTTTNEQSWNRQNLSSGAMQPGWDTSFEQYWSSRDSDREMDVGNGEGMIPYRIGNDGTNDYLEVSYGESQYATRHAAGEWRDTSLWVWTTGGGGNVRNQKISWTVLQSVQVADVGDGSAGLRLTIKSGVGGFLSRAPGFVFGGAGGTPDRVVLTQNYGLLPTTKGNNKRWEVGRKFWLTDTTVVFDADASPHVSSCMPMRLWENDGTETPRRAMGMHPGLGYPALNVTPAGAFEQLAGGGIGATMVWRRAQYTRKPTGTPCGRGTGWKPPLLVQAEVETTTTTVRAVRYPLEGYAGTAWLTSDYASQKDIAVEDWAEDAQTIDFAQLAFRLWQASSSSHQSGTVVKPSARDNAIWLDLAVRCSLYSGITTARVSAVAGSSPAGSMLEGVWAPLTEVVLDFHSDTVSFGFDNGHPMEDITSELYEKTGITLTSLAQKNAEYARALAQLAQCIQGSQTNETPTSVCADRVFGNDGQSIAKKITTSSKPQQEAGAKATGAAW